MAGVDVWNIEGFLLYSRSTNLIGRMSSESAYV